MLSSYVVWDASPIIVQLGPFAVRWYGLLFALAFVLGYRIVRSMYRREGQPESHLDTLLLYMMAGTIIGARLGHVLFYDPAYYLSRPLEIVEVWKGGLASHGGAVGILVALYLFSRRHAAQPYLWLLDRIAVPAALGGFFIRLGNLFNSEILGKPTDVPWAMVFARVDALPRHPVQLYESIGYGLIFLALYAVYRKFRSRTPHGLLLGLFMTSVFVLRFVAEFAKVPQAAYDVQLPLTMGQILSIPMIMAGVVLLVRAGSGRRQEGESARVSSLKSRPSNADAMPSRRLARAA